MRTVTCGSCGSAEFILQSVCRLQIPETEQDLNGVITENAQTIYTCLHCRAILQENTLFKPFFEFVVINTPRDKIRKAVEFYQKYEANIFFLFASVREMFHLEAHNLKNQASSMYLLNEVADIKAENVFLTAIMDKIPGLLKNKNIFAILTDNEYSPIDEITFLEKWGKVYNIRFYSKREKVS